MAEKLKWQQELSAKTQFKWAKMLNKWFGNGETIKGQKLQTALLQLTRL